MTWKELMESIAAEIERNPVVADMDATVWLYDDVIYRSGEHAILGVDACFPNEDVGEENRLSINLLEDDGTVLL